MTRHTTKGVLFYGPTGNRIWLGCDMFAGTIESVIELPVRDGGLAICIVKTSRGSRYDVAEDFDNTVRKLGLQIVCDAEEAQAEFEQAMERDQLDEDPTPPAEEEP